MDTRNHFSTRIIAILFPALLALAALTGCQGKEPSKINAENNTAQTPAEQAETIGEALGITAAKPALGTDGQVLLSLKTKPLHYSDAGLLVALEGEATFAEGVQLDQTLWRQTAGPEALLLNAEQLQAQVIIPHVTTTTDLEFALSAADTEGRVAETRTRIRVLPVATPPPAATSIAIGEAGLVTVTLSLPEPPDTPVKLQYATQDGTAQSGRDYQATQGQVTVDSANPEAAIKITALNPGVVSGDLYFRLYYTIEPNTKGHSLYVVLPRDRTGAPSQPVEPGPTEPGPIEPVEPTEPEPTPTTYTITYSAGEGGHLQGDAAQNLNANETGLPVTAIADPGYRFISWSDGLTTSTRTATDVNANLQVTAQFRRNELWLATGHNGNLSVNAGPTTATIDWPAEAGKTYNLIVTADPETEIENYSAYEARMFANVTPPLKIDELSTDEPVYIALEEDGNLKAWSSFVPRVLGTDGHVQTIALDEDGTRYIGGGFTQVSQNTGGGATLVANTNHSEHVLAGPVINGEVHAAISDQYGGWYVGGSFTQINGQSREYLAHINAAGQLTDWNPKILGAVYALALDQNIIYVGGSFTIGSRNRLAAFDRQGQLLPWNPSAGQTVYAIAVSKDIIYTASGGLQGSLTAFDKQGQALPWSSRLTGSAARTYVYALAIAEDIIYVAGGFTHADGVPRNHLAAFDTDGNLLPWDPNPNASVNALAINQGVIYVGGNFREIANEPREQLAALDLHGQILPWNPNISNPGTASDIKTIFAREGVIYVGGYFSHANGERRNNLAAFDNQGKLLPSGPGTNYVVNTLASVDGLIYVGGGFSLAGGEHRSSLAALDKDGLLLPWSPEISDTVLDGLPTVNSVVVDNEVVYIGGIFLKAARTERSNLAAFDKNGNLLPWNPTLNGVAMVNNLRKTQDIIYVAGLLLWADSRASYGLEAFDTQGNLQTWAPVINNEIKALTIDQGVVYAGKQFYQNGILKGSLENAENFAVNALSLSKNVIYAGGQIGQPGSPGRAALAAFDLQGKPLSWAPQLSGALQFYQSEVYSIVEHENVIYVGGSFTTANGDTREHLASFDADGNLSLWNPVVNAPVNVLTINEGVIYAGGGFTRAGGKPRSSLATFDLQGNLLNK